jgi:hypothetical protein
MFGPALHHPAVLRLYDVRRTRRAQARIAAVRSEPYRSEAHRAAMQQQLKPVLGWAGWGYVGELRTLRREQPGGDLQLHGVGKGRARQVCAGAGSRGW